MKIKICGMKYAKNIEEVAALEPQYLGFIFYDRSRRHFEGNIPVLSDKIAKVGVFVNAEASQIRSKVQEHSLKAVQLHGDESPQDCRLLRLELGAGIEIIKAFPLSEEFDFKQLEKYDDCCDFFLFDTKGKDRGGNGILFDWSILEKYSLKKPYFLSGGIGLQEVGRVRSFLQSGAAACCHALDLNSKFESKPGMKKIEELKKFIELTTKEN